MSSNELQAIGLCDLQEPTIPPRSRLYNLKPVGIGTPEVESLTSYIVRLAEEHCIPTGILILSELVPLLKEGYIFKSKDGGLDKIFPNQTKALNGMGSWALKLIKTLESLTLRNDLRLLTMLNWVEIIPPRNLFRSARAWCPSCYENWRVTEQTVYEPLLWSLKEVTICLHHHQHLFTECPYCRKNNRLLAWRSRPGCCSKCGEWLGISANIESPNSIKLTEDELNWQIWVINNLGNLIAATPHLSPPPKEKISEKLSAYVNTLAHGNIAAFANKLEINRSQTHRWCVGKTLPTIDTLLQICFQLEISLLDFLTKEEINVDSSKIITQNQNKPSKEGTYQLNTSTEVLHALETALTKSPPPSLVEIAEWLGYKKTSALYYYSSDLCKIIATRHSEYEKAQRLEKLQRLLEELLAAKEYPPPSMQEVAKRFGKKSVHSLDKHFPELCSAISARYANYRQESRTKRVEKLRQEVWKVASQLHSEGVEPTASRISVFLKSPGSIIQKEVVEAVFEVRRKLGWEK
ncbi:TniQ family protein [Nostoc sp. ChiSLP03a]|uniref:TniQ family protein n=1 Tax=Nostoc sp. ChiSLP03a TaxID=3075380 RepID=UPI002AD2C5AD|nr:TniQ family protein [Nostoc sp. ChiSLP03a]MDZ8215656.1 TniQ family protein [Nostoc sp. ChiSLP03a]